MTSTSLGRPDLKRFQDIPVTVLTDWTRDMAKVVIDQHDRGYFAGTAQLSEAMLRDDAISSALETRILGLLGCDTQVAPPKGHDGDELAREAAEQLEANWQKMLPDDVLKGLLRWAVLMRFCLAELLWEGDETHWRFTLKLWHPMFVWYDIAKRQYVVNTQDGPQWIEPGKGKWFLWAPDGYYRGWILGAVRSLADPWLARTFNFRDWARYCEVHGLPIRKISAPSEAPESEKDAFFNQVAVLGSDNTLLCPQGVGKDAQGWNFELVEAVGGEWESFQAFKNDCSTRISIRLLGQNLTTEVQGGSYSAAQVHNLVRLDYKKADAKSFATALREQCFGPWALFNYGSVDLAPEVTWGIEPPDDEKAKADTLVSLSTALLNLAQVAPEVDRRALLEQYELPLEPPKKSQDDGGTQIFAYHIQAGVVTINEVRAGLGLAPIPGGDVPPTPLAPAAEGDATTMAQATTKATTASRVTAPPASAAAGRYVEDAASIARDRAADALRPDVEALLGAITEGASYDEIRTAIGKAAASMDPSRLAKVTEEVLVLSQLAGRHAIATDHKDAP